MYAVIILILVVVVIVAVLAGMYNSLVRRRNQVDNSWSQIEVQLKRRHDLIPNLVESVKDYMAYEQETLTAVTQARAAAIQAGDRGPQAQAEAENALTGTLKSLFAVAENYPDLKANQNVMQLQEELTSTENRVAFARQLYNDTATEYNVKQQQFPWNLVAGLAKADVVELYEIEEASERDVPVVDLSMKPKA